MEIKNIKNKIIVFSGSTGFVGSEILNYLIRILNKNEKIICIINKTTPYIKHKNLIFRYGDSRKEETWEKLLEEFEINELIITSNIRHVESFLNVIKKSKNIKLPRLMILGTTGVYSKFEVYSAEYKRLEILISSYKGLFIVLRPTMIYGSSKDTNFHKLINFIAKFKLFFTFSNADVLLRPIYYKDLAKVFISAYKNKKISGYFDVAGNTIISYKKLLQTIFKELNLKPILINLPYKFVFYILQLCEHLKIKLLISSEQILRLQEDKTFNISKAKKVLKFKPIGIRRGLVLQLQSMKLRKK